MPDKYVVTLTPEERTELTEMTSKGQLSARKMKRAQILQASDRNVLDETIAQTLGVSLSTIHRTRQKFVEGGIEFALNEAPRVSGRKKLDAKAEAVLVATACSEPPSGRSKVVMELSNTERSSANQSRSSKSRVANGSISCRVATTARGLSTSGRERFVATGWILL